MGNVIDMASFEHLRSRDKSSQYTCPKTNVTFPAIYKVLVPDGDMDGDKPYFTGTFSAYYQLKEEPCYGNSDLPGFPESSATKINAIQADDKFYLDLVHIKDKEQSEGFKKACFHLGMNLEVVSWVEGEQGTFILLTRRGASKKNGHILYHTSKNEYIEQLGGVMPCDYVAALNAQSEIVPLANIADQEDW